MQKHTTDNGADDQMVVAKDEKDENLSYTTSKIKEAYQ